MLAKTIWPIAAVVLLPVFLASCTTAACRTSSGVSRLAMVTIQAVGKASGKITKETIKVGGQSVTTIGKTTAKTSVKLVTETIQTTAGVATATGESYQQGIARIGENRTSHFRRRCQRFHHIHTVRIRHGLDHRHCSSQAGLWLQDL